MEWINVNERLPEDGNHVIIYGKTVGRTRSRFSKRNYAYGFDEDESWFWKNTSTKYAKKSITHWMPLPKPPKS